MKRALMALFVLALFAIPAKAWDCPSGQIRQQAPAGTPTTTPYYDVVEGIAFICVPTPSSTPQSPTSQSSAANSNSNSSSNSASKSNSSSNSNSNSQATGGNSNSIATATGGNQSQHQTQTATGGSASATGGAATASNDSSGNSTNVVTDIRNPAATAYAPNVGATVPCFKGYSGAAQTQAFGFSLGGGKIDKGCDIRETARLLAEMGAKQAACKVIITENAAKNAGLTLDDCMADIPQEIITAIPETAPVAPPVPAPVITVNVPAPIVTVIPPPVVAPKPDVAAVARQNRTVHHKHVVSPCITNDNISQPLKK